MAQLTCSSEFIAGKIKDQYPKLNDKPHGTIAIAEAAEADNPGSQHRQLNIPWPVRRDAAGMDSTITRSRGLHVVPDSRKKASTVAGGRLISHGRINVHERE